MITQSLLDLTLGLLTPPVVSGGMASLLMEEFSDFPAKHFGGERP